MNLPQIHPRVGLVRKAELEVLMEHTNILDSSSFKDLDYGDLLKAYNQIIINFLSDDKIYQNDFQKEMETALEGIWNKYELTLGEKLFIITKKSKSFADIIVSWERKK